MLVKLNNDYKKAIDEYLKKDLEYNLVIIGDIQRFGYDNYFFNLWAEIDERENIKGILVKYFDYVVVNADEDCNLHEFCNLLKRLNFYELSGKTRVVDKICKRVYFSKRRDVQFCRLLNDKKLINTRSRNIRKISFRNLKKVIKLYGELEEFENTTIESVKSSLKTGRGYCIEIDNKVITMAKSTLESKTHAMIIGVGTHKDYRQKGYATLCTSKLCEVLLHESKIPCLLYESEEAGNMYFKLGFEKIGKWSICNK